MSHVLIPRSRDWNQANDTDASRSEGKMHLTSDPETPSGKLSVKSAPLSDGSDTIGLVSVDWLLVRLNPKRADEG